MPFSNYTFISCNEDLRGKKEIPLGRIGYPIIIVSENINFKILFFDLCFIQVDRHTSHAMKF
jgi:hypothetical protein